jgi:uncharacterized protein
MNKKEEAALNIPTVIFQSFSILPNIGQCDCACANMISSKHEVPLLISSDLFYLTNHKLIKQPVNSTHHAVLSPFTNTFSVLNESAMRCIQYFNSPKTLESIPSTWSENWGEIPVRSTLEQMLQLGLLVPETWQTESSISFEDKLCIPEEAPDTLAAWLHVTNRCNLRCAYCYLLHHNADMSLETGRAAIEATFRSAIAHHYRKVKFKYAGGEPLLRFPFVTELHQYAQALAEQYGLELDGVVLSNGTLLTKEIVKEMQMLGLRLMISLDNVPTPGLSQEENYQFLPSPNLSHQGRGIQRNYPDGRDAAGDAMRAVELALDCGLVPAISITVSGRNVAHLPELLTWVLERDLPFSLNFYREHNCTANVPFANRKRDACGTSDDLKIDEETFISGMLAAYKKIESNLPQRSLLASLVDLANFAAPHLRRCSVGHSYLVFDCEGRVSKCQMQMEKPVTSVHADDPLGMIRADSCGIQNVTVDEKEGCQACQWRYWCAGGCPLETFRATGRYDLKSPNCNIYRSFYPEVLRLEGLRLLKYASF